MVKQLEESKNMEAEERARLEAEINAKREEVSESQQDFNTLFLYGIGVYNDFTFFPCRLR